ncbi:hypothetical protein M9H77_35675 [Catharanthus roseus]|uniref:Uncharacterized protein n=1 Tax=Catharanthus roseus TaxID=4058 RepID=A0ACB9ZPY8_CATRO|nr:hypothetical protein M9H77_35675 [Catharanthus roseus]
MPCLKDKPVSDSPSGIPRIGSIPVEVEVTFEPSQEHTHEPQTNEELDILSSVPDLTSVLETDVLGLEGSDDEEDHPEAQAQTLRDYQLSRDRFRRAHKEPTRYSYSYIVSYAFAVASYVEEKEPLCFFYVLKSSNPSLWLRAMDEEMTSSDKNKT